MYGNILETESNLKKKIKKIKKKVVLLFLFRKMRWIYILQKQSSPQK